MDKHFCTCSALDCSKHPYRHDAGCDLCVKKNLELGEIPACFWNNDVVGTTEYSSQNFAKFVMEKHS